MEVWSREYFLPVKLVCICSKGEIEWIWHHCWERVNIPWCLKRSRFNIDFQRWKESLKHCQRHNGGETPDSCYKLLAGNKLVYRYKQTFLPAFTSWRQFWQVDYQGSTFRLIIIHFEVTRDHVLLARMLWFFDCRHNSYKIKCFRHPIAKKSVLSHK